MSGLDIIRDRLNCFQYLLRLDGVSYFILSDSPDLIQLASIKMRVLSVFHSKPHGNLVFFSKINDWFTIFYIPFVYYVVWNWIFTGMNVRNVFELYRNVRIIFWTETIVRSKGIVIEFVIYLWISCLYEYHVDSVYSNNKNFRMWLDSNLRKRLCNLWR